MTEKDIKDYFKEGDGEKVVLNKFEDRAREIRELEDKVLNVLIVNEKAVPTEEEMKAHFQEEKSEDISKAFEDMDGRIKKLKTIKRNLENQEEIIQNITPKHLIVEGDNDSRIELAPLEKRSIKKQILESQFNIDLISQYVLVEKQDSPGTKTSGIDIDAPTLMVVVIAYLMIGSLLSDEYPIIDPWIWIFGGLALLIFLFTPVFSSMTAKMSITRWLNQSISLLFILTIGIGLPIFTVYLFGGGKDLLIREPPLALFGRLLQIMFIATASLFPALLYYLFDRYKLATLKGKFCQDIFRLDPDIKTIRDIEAKYGKQIEDIYGSDKSVGEGRLIRGTRWPILVSTLMITLGWILTLLPVGIVMNAEQSSDFIYLLVPQQSVLVFGFLGAYFFGLTMILRRYARGDLRPKAYSQVAGRIFTSFILAWILGALFENITPSILFLAFLFGFLPETFWIFIREFFQNNKFINKFTSITQENIQEKHPLTNLDGIDLYDLARLMDEGVANIESLAHHDLVDLLLETRIPCPRLIDWIDQAILYLHLATCNKANGSSNLEKLCEYGIRTATDLILAYVSAEDAKYDEAFLKILDDNAKEPPYRLQVIINAILDDEWLRYIINWRNFGGIEEETIVASSKG